MTDMSDFLEVELIKHLFRTGSFTKPVDIAICLLTTAADDANTGIFTAATPGVEVTAAGGYERANDANTGGGASNTTDPLDANWSAVGGGTDGQTDNVSAITYAQATASWGDVAAMAITNAAAHNTGDLLFHSTVTTTRTIDSGDTAEFAIGAITVTLD